MATNYWPQVIADLESIINTACPDVTFIAESPDFDKLDWEDLERQGQIVFPFALYCLPAFSTSEISNIALAWYEGEISIYYVALDNADVLTTIRGKLWALGNNLRTVSYEAIQATEKMSVNWSPSNPVNLRLQAQKLTATAGCLTFTAIVPAENIP